MSNKFKVNKYGPITERRDYSKTVNNLPVSNLVETQLKSYKEFLDEGIDQALNNIYPIISTNKRIKIEYIQGTLRFEFPEDEFDAIKLAKQKGSTYAVKVYAQLRKIDNETGETSSQEVLFCDIPLMTKGASFIINGSEKVIVSQLLRSAGAYCNLNVPIKDGSFYNRLEVIPRLGAWVEIQHKITDGTSTAKKVAKKVREVNHEVKASGDVEAKNLVREIERVFNQQTSIKSETELKIILKTKKTGAPLTPEGIGIDAVVFQDGIDVKYLLKGKIKNSFLVVRVVLEDTENGAKVQKDIKVLAETLNASQVVVKIDKTKIGTISTLLRAFKMTKNDIKNLYGNLPIVDKSIVTDKTSTEIDAIDAIHSALRKGDRITTESRKNLFANIFFNKRRYDLSKTGRYNLNRKLNIIDRIENTFLAEDLVGIEGNVVFAKGTFIDFALANEIHEAFRTKVLPLTEIPGVSSEIYASTLESNPELARLTKIVFVKVWPNKKWMENEYEPVNVIGNDPNTEVTHLTVPDIIASIGYYLNLSDQSEKIKTETDFVSIGSEDDPDSLINKRIVAVGELLKNQLQIGLTAMERNAKERMSSREQEKITPKNITNNKSIFKQFSVFFNSSQLSQFMDQMNPLAEVSNKRRVTSLGPSGLNRDTAKFEVRDVHSTHYGRLCPIETPEGPNIGLILSFANYAKVNELGFIEAPYFAVKDGVVDATEVHYLTAAEEIGKTFVQSSLLLDENGKIIDEEVTARRSGDYVVVKSTEVNFMDVSSKQITSVASSAIPFLENDDANRALMGANMQRQAVPLLKPEAPFVGTGIESEIARFSASNIHAKEDGVIEYVDSKRIIIKSNDGETQTYNLRTFERSNQGSVITQRPIVNVGQQVKAGDVLVDGPSFEKGEMALGKNVVVAFTTWNGYNYEDAVIISEKLVKDDVYTSIHIEEQTLQFRKSKIGDDILTNDIPNTSKFSRRNLDDSGIVRVGSEVVPGDILVGRTSPKGEENQTPEEKLIQAIFTNKSKNVKDTSLKVKNGHGGTVIDTQVLSRENGDKLQDDMSMIVKVFIAQKRKIKVGDKMAGRHGNKGIISRVLPIEDMPHLEDGTPVDIMLNPQGVPSRMNIGQVLELHLGMAAKSLNVKFASPVFDGVKYQNINDALEEAGLPRNGKFDLYDPITNKKFDAKISVGVMYMLKLAHMIDDKMHARSVGPYSLITQQPLGGKSQNGGQRFGEMETWSIESYGATNVLQELLTYKSDNIEGRNKVYSSLTTGAPLPEAGTPESFNVLAYELRGLGIKLSAEVKEEETNND